MGVNVFQSKEDVMASAAMISTKVLLAAALFAGVGSAVVFAKKGRDEVKAEVGEQIDDRTRHGRGNGESGRSIDGTSGTSGSGSGGGHREGYDRSNGSGSGSGSSGSGTGVASAGGGSSSGSGQGNLRRDELDRF